MKAERQAFEKRFRALDVDAAGFSADVWTLARDIAGPPDRGEPFADADASCLIVSVLIATCLDHHAEDRPGLAVLYQSFRPDARHGLPIDSERFREHWPDLADRYARFVDHTAFNHTQRATLAHAYRKMSRLFAV